MTHPSIPIAADQALRMVLQATPTATPRSVPLLQAAGLRLAEDVRADRDSNGPMLAAMAVECGLESARLLHADDDVTAIVGALETMQDCDLLVLTGGVSMGRYDLVPDSFRQIGAELVFHKVSQKPGKPLLFARRGRQLLFGLPGNPLAAHLCFHRYVAAAIRRWCGHEPAWADHRVGRLLAPVRARDCRTCFLPGRAQRMDPSESGWHLQPLLGRSSADLFGTSQANCYLEVPPGDGSIAAGESLGFEWLAYGSPGSWSRLRGNVA